MFKLVLSVALLLLSFTSVAFAGATDAFSDFGPWVLVDSSNGIDTYSSFSQYRSDDEEVMEAYVLYDYKAESKAKLTQFYFNYSKKTYKELIRYRRLARYSGSKSENIGTEDAGDIFKFLPIPEAGPINKLAYAVRDYGRKKIVGNILGTYFEKSSDGGFKVDGKDLRLIRNKDGSIQVLFFPGYSDRRVLSNKIYLHIPVDGSHDFRYNKFLKKEDNRFISGTKLKTYISMGDVDVLKYKINLTSPNYDIYVINIEFIGNSAKVELEKVMNGKMSGQRDYSTSADMVWVSDS